MTKTKTNRNKATHEGSCQACGSYQKLPGGVLSMHGYTTKWGFFSGICAGAGYKAFEESCDLIERFIASVREKRAQAEAFKAELLERPAEGTTEAWVRVYIPPTWTAKNGYMWRKVALTLTVTPHSDGDGYYTTVEYPDQDPKRAGRMHKLEFYDCCRDEQYRASTNLLDYIQVQNRKRAADVDGDIAKMDEYIRWQQQRVAGWKPGKLTPVKGA